MWKNGSRKFGEGIQVGRFSTAEAFAYPANMAEVKRKFHDCNTAIAIANEDVIHWHLNRLAANDADRAKT